MKPYQQIKERVYSLLENGLPAELSYHCPEHTTDVLEVCEAYIERENINDEKAELLRLGAIFHDAGFIVSTENHEEHGVEIAREIMSAYNYSDQQIAKVAGLIRATRIPQSPGTLLEKIICDADLDYLGRDNFYEISDRLMRELNALGNNLDELTWNKMQIRFLENHNYYTSYARQHLQPVKEKRLEELRGKV